MRRRTLDHYQALVANLQQEEKSLLPYSTHHGEWLHIQTLLRAAKARLKIAEEDERDRIEAKRDYQAYLRDLKALERRGSFRVLAGGKTGGKT